MILFCRELVSGSRNLNQRKSKSLSEVGRHFNVEVGIYYFCQFTILTPILSFSRGIFDSKKAITNFILPIYYFNLIFKLLVN